jgi:epoxide hydrolase 4
MNEVPELEGAHHRTVAVGEVKLHAVEMGEGRPVILLHGFPELWWSWRRQLPALARAGLHAVAPDLRGYGGSDRPPDVEAYALPRLVDDVAGLVRALGAGRASLVGHDWGGAVAWSLAARHPELVDRLVIMNAPHPAVFLRALLRPDQLLRSAYMALFQLPELPERLLFARDAALLRRGLRALRATPVADAELDVYVEAGRRADRLRGGLNSYRAMGRALVGRGRRRSPGEAGRPAAGAARARGRRIEAPVLVIWGEQDPVLGRALAAPPPHLVPDARVVRLPNASHAVMLDAAEEVNRLLVEFLG